ncbi:MAG: hypothetical protein RIG62_02840 [Cyclobacteriaceae bacterium]
MSQTEERIWADAHSRGRIEQDPGPVFWLWNFDINDDQPRPEHISFLAGPDFMRFLILQFRHGHPIEITGLASSSGSQRLNLDLSRRRAQQVKQLVIEVLKIMRNRRLIDPSFTDPLLNRSIIASGAGRSTIFFHRASDTIPVPVHEEGGQYANNRGVRICLSPNGKLTDDQIEIIGRAYLRTKFPQLPAYFSFWEMWAPTSDAIVQLVPRLPNENSTLRGRRVPPNWPWRNFRPGSRAMIEAGFAEGEFSTMRYWLRNFMYNDAEVHRNIDRFISNAAAAKNRIQELERRIVQWSHRTAAIGGGGMMVHDLRRYLTFRRIVFLEDPNCLLHYNGFRPTDFPLPAR